MSHHLFSSFKLGKFSIPNRIMLSPMCQYSAANDGRATDWHLVHLGSRAVGGAGIVMTEATAVEPRGRISNHDIGIWTDKQIDPLRRIARFVIEQDCIPAIQLSHSGRKGSLEVPWNGGQPLQPSSGGWEVVAPVEDPYPSDSGKSAVTLAAGHADIQRIINAFAASAKRALQAGFQIIEIHAAHGYLIHQFLSPITNKRNDKYGGGFKNRVRLLLEIIESVREVWPNEYPLFVRISATDWLPDCNSWSVTQSIRLVKELQNMSVDLVDVSTGGLVPYQKLPNTGPSYQLPFAERIKEAVSGMSIATVGHITNPVQADEIIRNERADLVVIGRQHLREPYFSHNAADVLGHHYLDDYPVQYARAYRR